MTADSHKTKHRTQRLKTKHLKAIQLILLGHSDSEVADFLKVCRETVNRWRNHNELFKAELKRQQDEIHEIIKDQEVVVALKALKNLEDRVCWDATSAMNFIRFMGIKRPVKETQHIVDDVKE